MAPRRHMPLVAVDQRAGEVEQNRFDRHLMLVVNRGPRPVPDWRVRPFAT